MVKVGPDLVVTLSAPTSGGAGGTITVTDKTLNQGAGNVQVQTSTAFFLSTNAVLDASDTALGSRLVPPLAAGTFDTTTTTLTLPAGLAPGTYYLLAQADASNAVAES